MNRLAKQGFLGIVALFVAANIAAAQQKGGTPTTGTPSGGTPVTGTPPSGTPVTGTPSAGTPVTGAPMKGGTTPNAGTPTVSPTPSVVGTPNAGTPLNTSGTPITGTAVNLNAGMTQNALFSNNAFQKNLNLNPQQNTQLSKIYNDQFTAFQQQLNALPQNLSADQRALQVQQLRQNFDKNFNAASAGVFSTPQQRQRYDQIYAQFQNYGTFNNPNVQQKLNLTDTQRQQLSQFEQGWNQQLNQIRQTYATDPTAASQMFATLQQQNSQNINAVLTPQQLNSYRQIIGDPFTFQPTDFFTTTATPFKAVNPTGNNQ